MDLGCRITRPMNSTACHCHGFTFGFCRTWRQVTRRWRFSVTIPPCAARIPLPLPNAAFHGIPRLFFTAAAPRTWVACIDSCCHHHMTAFQRLPLFLLRDAHLTLWLPHPPTHTTTQHTLYPRYICPGTPTPHATRFPPRARVRCHLPYAPLPPPAIGGAVGRGRDLLCHGMTGVGKNAGCGDGRCVTCRWPRGENDVGVAWWCDGRTVWAIRGTMNVGDDCWADVYG